MGKIEKKKKRLLESINKLEQELILSLTKKTTNSVEINVPKQQRRIADLKLQLSKL
jgi:hypothetical protein